MKYAPYPESIESGVAWIGRIPKHWQVMKLHHMVRMKSGSAITSVVMDDDAAYPVYGGNGVRGMFPEFTHEGSYALIGRQGAECGNINYAHGKFWASEHAVVATPDRDLEYRWLGETLRAMNLNQYSQAAAQPGLSVEVIGRLKVPFPSLPEQQQIAAFLDWKTGQIDALIARKKELLGKLNEKRLAVITQAVTRGLNPDAPLRDSGIGWLGQVPTHWEVKRLKFFTERVFTGSTPPSDESQFYEEPTVNWFTPSDFTDDGTPVANSNRKLNRAAVEQGLVRYFEQPCALIVSIGATLGRVGYSEGSFSCNQQINVVVPAAEMDAKFLSYSLFIKRETMKVISNATTLGIMNQETTRQIEIAAPLLSEQVEVVSYLEKSVREFDLLSEKIETAAARLTEYRTALITAATTGKIDVRGVKIPQAAA
jgi:type I restriction enzyme S subunit